MDNYPMNSPDPHYPQRQQQQQQHWPTHLLAPNSHPQASFPSPPASEHGQQQQQQHYPQFFQTQAQAQAQQQQQQQQSDRPQGDPTRNTTSLTLNLSSLTVASPTNLSPINAPTVSGPPPSGMAPSTPISPSGGPFAHHHLHTSHNVHNHHGHPHGGHMQSPFSFDPNQGQNQSAQQTPAPQQHYEDQHQQQQQHQHHQPPPGSSGGYENRRTPAPSRSSSASNSTTSQLPRKRSFTGNIASPSSGGPNSSGIAGPSGLSINTVSVGSPLVEEAMYDDEARDAAMELASAVSYDELEVRTAYGGGNTPGNGGANSGGNASPVDGSGSASGEDSYGVMNSVGGTMNVLGKPLATNNFVTKLYQMINDPKSAQFIAWTELGTSFVVSNVGEFSRSILGGHFKHNNFSSFVRQLNMYGFHKINRTPRAQRTSTDAQTWEFSHTKFLRGRPDLLDEIKRKALEPDPAVKHRVELPGEVAAQLNAMRDENMRMWDQLSSERRKVEKLVNVVGRLWDVVGMRFPGSVPQFPSDLLESAESPNIYITSPTSTSRYPPPLSMNMHTMHNLSSPNSSPTASDFPSSHLHHSHSQPHSLSRQHSFQHVGYRGDSTASTPLPSSPGSISMDIFEDGTHDAPSGRASTKRQRLDESGVGVGVNVSGLNGISSNDSMSLMSSVSSPGSGPVLSNLTVPKKSSRARSDSAPLGYATPLWQQGGLGPGSGSVGVGRPRSGSGMMPRGVPNIGNMTRSNNASTPLLSITTVDTDINR